LSVSPIERSKCQERDKDQVAIEKCLESVNFVVLKAFFIV
jgi:hypothetical protein